MSDKLSGENQAIDMSLQDIMRCIQHRYPLLMIDRIRDLVAGKSAIGIKAVTASEPHFQGHFPDFPIMPGVLIIEAMAQTAAVMAIKGLEEKFESNNVFFMGISNAKFRKPVIPGDVLHLHVWVINNRRVFWKVGGKAYVGDELVTEATLTAMIEG